MVIIAKLLTGIFIALSADSLDTYTSIESNNEQAELYVSNYIIRNPREKAFQILDNKCNVCHSKRNKRRVFTIENMDDFAPDIYKQVFVKKRMPKGRKIKLTSEEYKDILTWISNKKNKQNGTKL
ncbi:hypothetical protein K8354_04305 [Polaribacter litorisediminis]|uniref:hypothetical protein n=1 Tax=Polaribacter litorisediminis TaxID=1908341 RepID=UPI001CBEFEC3|nr:hypothetical protein [Polaribacter litorisediminis]UAM99052.1 hypothetical protein K8354_04305 [Polaribacter litorisediminis]